MGLGRYIRIDPEENLGLASHFLGGLCQMLQFLARVHGHAYARLDGHLVIPLALGVAVVEDLILRDAGHAHHGKLARREDVRAHAFLGGDAQDGKVPVGLYCEVLVRIGKGTMVSANVLTEAFLGGNVKRSAQLLCKGNAVDVFDKEMIIARGEMRFRSEHEL